MSELATGPVRDPFIETRFCDGRYGWTCTSCGTVHPCRFATEEAAHEDGAEHCCLDFVGIL